MRAEENEIPSDRRYSKRFKMGGRKGKLLLRC